MSVWIAASFVLFYRFCLNHFSVPLHHRPHLAADFLSEMRDAPRPVVLSPDQSEGDIADVPFFPKPRAQEERVRQAEKKRQHISHRTRQIMLLVGLVLLVIGGSSAGFFIGRDYQIASATAHATATAQATIYAPPTATAQAQATADAIGIHNPYGGTLKLDDPLHDNSNGNGWDEMTNSATNSGGNWPVSAILTKRYDVPYNYA